MSNPAIMMYVPFALNGQRNEILVSRIVSQAVQDATYSTGFPDATMTPKASGGKPPNGKDFNGLFYAITLDLIHRQSGKQIQYDADHATNIGGYAKGSIVQSTDLTKSYISTADGNLTDPDSPASKNWTVYSQPPLATSTTTGTVKIADNLTSTEKDTALTANQGRVLASMLSSSNKDQVIGGNSIKWGRTKGFSLGENKIRFEPPFPNACFVAMAINSTDGNDNSYTVVSYPPTRDGFNFSARKSPSDNTNLLIDITWFAIGN